MGGDEIDVGAVNAAPARAARVGPWRSRCRLACRLAGSLAASRERPPPDRSRHADANGWAGGMDKLDFAATFLDPKVPLQVSHIRLQRSRRLLDDILKAHGQVSIDDAPRVLSDHYEDTFLAGPLFNPADPTSSRCACMTTPPDSPGATPRPRWSPSFPRLESRSCGGPPPLRAPASISRSR
jgi:hypothetical protein